MDGDGWTDGPMGRRGHAGCMLAGNIIHRVPLPFPELALSSPALSLSLDSTREAL